MPVSRSIMLIAGESSGDLRAAELIKALRESAPADTLTFFGAGGPRMAAAGMELLIDMLEHAVVGPMDVLRHYTAFKRLFHQLQSIARTRRPDAILFIDFSGFNLRLAKALRSAIQSDPSWNTKLIYYISPQVWASRPQRARVMEQCLDLVLAIFPFEPDWYARQAPNLKVEFVGHPILDQYPAPARPELPAARPHPGAPAKILLLPGSRRRELQRHLPLMIDAVHQVQQETPLEATIVVPTPGLATLAHSYLPGASTIQIEAGSLPEHLSTATLAIASTGTVTMECAYFHLPFIAIYRTSWLTYQLGKRLVTVPYLAMPNILAGRQIVPERIQQEATPENLADDLQHLLQHPQTLRQIQADLKTVIASLGSPGAAHRAATAIHQVLS